MAGYSVTFSVVDQATAQIERINRRIRQMREPMERQAKAFATFVDASGLQKVAEGFGSIARGAAEAFASMSRLVPIMGTLTGAASIAGMVSLVRSWAEFGTTLQNNADQFGVTAQQLYDLQQATRMAGGNADDMTDSLKGLTETLYKAKLGNAESIAWLNKSGVEWHKANGEIKTATELLPDVIKHIEALKDPQDRLRVAQGLGSEALARLTQEFQRSGQALPDWLKLAQAADAQFDPDKLNKYNTAVGGLDATFQNLKMSIGTTLATALTPLIKEFDTWVQTHQPQIQQGITDIGNALVWLGKHLDTVRDVLIGVGALWAGTWVTSIVGSIGTVVGALGAVGSIAGGGFVLGTGLLGALGAVAWLSYEIYQHWDEIKKAIPDIAAGMTSALGQATKSMKDFWQGKPSGPAPAAPSGPPGPQRPEVGAINPFTGLPIQPTPGTQIAPGAGPSSFSGDKAEFLTKAWPLAQQVAAQTGLDPRVILAQAATESGWGKHAPGQNFFGIGGAGNLRQYGSMEESFQAYADLINKQYPEARAGKTPEEQIAGLVKGGYTGDAGYADQLNAIVKQLPPPSATGPGGAVIPSAASKGVNPELHKAMEDAYNQILPPGYTAKVTSGERTGDPRSQHYTGSAEDWQIYDPQGKPIRNRGEDVTGLYTKAFTQGLANMMVSNPELAKKMASGIHFGTAIGGGGEADLMHVDVGGPRGHIGDAYAERPEAARLAALQAQGKPAEVTGGPPVSGSVDVTVTHKNPPPGATVTASGTGDVNVAPPRTEQQQLQSI